MGSGVPGYQGRCFATGFEPPAPPARAGFLPEFPPQAVLLGPGFSPRGASSANDTQPLIATLCGGGRGSPPPCCSLGACVRGSNPGPCLGLRGLLAWCCVLVFAPSLAPAVCPCLFAALPPLPPVAPLAPAGCMPPALCVPRDGDGGSGATGVLVPKMSQKWGVFITLY